jgi:hypothetical protein
MNAAPRFRKAKSIISLEPGKNNKGRPHPRIIVRNVPGWCVAVDGWEFLVHRPLVFSGKWSLSHRDRIGFALSEENRWSMTYMQTGVALVASRAAPREHLVNAARSIIGSTSSEWMATQLMRQLARQACGPAWHYNFETETYDEDSPAPAFPG